MRVTETLKYDLIKIYLQKHINKIQSPNITTFTEKSLIHIIPDYFWTAPASFSGKYHNQDECEKHGLLLHTHRVCGLVENLISMIPNEIDSGRVLSDHLYSAAILHDTFKCGFKGRENYYNNNLSTDYLHPYYVRVGLSNGAQYNKYAFFNSIMEIIEGHMGKWSQIPKTFNTYDLKNPVCLLHVADCIASRKLKNWFNL